MRRIFLVLTGIMLLSGLAAAQAELDRGPGMVGPGSPIYGLEVAWDNAAMGIGLKQAGDVAQERAAEARQAQERGNHEAAQRAAENMNKVAQRASADDTEGLQKAEAVLQEVAANAPEEAQQGLQTALNNVRQAQQRIPDDAGPGDQPGTGDDTGGDEVNASEQIADAQALREQGRQNLREGNDALDNDNLETARTEFGQASQRFADAIDLVEGLDTAEATDLEQQLRDARQSADDARASVGQQLDTNQTQDGGGQQ